MEVKTINFVKKGKEPVRTKVSKVATQVTALFEQLSKLPKGESAVIDIDGKSTQTFMTRMREACTVYGYECYRVKNQVVVTRKDSKDAKASSK